MVILKNAYHKNTRVHGRDPVEELKSGKAASSAMPETGGRSETASAETAPDFSDNDITGTSYTDEEQLSGTQTDNTTDGLSDEELFRVIPYNPARADDISDVSYSYWKSVFYYFSRKRITLVLLIVFAVLLILSFLLPEVCKYDYRNLVADTEYSFIRPCSEYLFGTDNIGRDYFCQVWAASRTSITMALLVAAGQTFLGVLFGLIWGYVRKLDGLFSFLFNIVDNVPTIIYLTLISFVIGQGFSIMSTSLILIGWLGTALNVRNMVLMLRDREFNTASRCLGTSTGRILVKNLLPQLISVLLLSLTLSIPETIAMESTLSFLGLGLGIDTPSLGLLLQNARGYFIDYPYLLVIPSIIVSLITITFYLVGNAFADASDPRNHR